MAKTMKHAEDVELTSEELMKEMNEAGAGGVVEGSTIRWHQPAQDSPEAEAAAERAMEEIRQANEAATQRATKATETDLRATLDSRARTHGEYSERAAVTQMLKQIMRAAPKWDDLNYHEQETLEMVAHKISRILCGDPHAHDHWHDIAGYATLSADRNR